MGFNTTVLICNDAFDAMEKDPKGFVNKILEGAMKCRGNERFEFGLGSHGNGFEVMTCDHADVVNLIAVGGNYSTVITQTYWGNRGHHRPDEKLELLRQAAESLGYDLVPKAPSK